MTCKIHPKEKATHTRRELGEGKERVPICEDCYKILKEIAEHNGHVDFWDFREIDNE